MGKRVPLPLCPAGPPLPPRHRAGELVPPLHPTTAGERMPPACCYSHPEGRAAIICRFRSAAAPVRIHLASPSEPRYRRCELSPRPASPCSPMPEAAPEIHLSENEGIKGVLFAVTGEQGFIDAALCLELISHGALEKCSLNLRDSSFGFQQYLSADVPFFQGNGG